MKNTPGLIVTTPSDRVIAMTRVFDAPRQLVFDAWTRPELVRRWLGVVGGWTFAECEIVLRVGGAYRFLWRGPDGAELGMRGVYREITPPERLVSTEAFDQSWYPGEALVTSVFVEEDGKTTLTTTVRYESREARDVVLKSPMEQGVAAGYDRLDVVLAAQREREEIRARYRARADRFERLVAAVRPDQWSNQSPCEDWKARDVVRHIVDMHGVTLRPLGRPLSPAPSVDDDPLGAFRAARADIEAVLADPEQAEVEYAFFTGPTTVQRTVDQVPSVDMVWHGWDLARATGQDDSIDADEVRGALANIGMYSDEVLRQPGVLGPALEPPSGADDQTRLLAFLGRKAW